VAAVLSSSLLAFAIHAQAQSPAELLQELDNFPHTRRMSHDTRSVVDYEIGLGAIQKRSGVWAFKRSERLSGELVRYTWQVVDGFSTEDVLEELAERLAENGRLLFACDSRACGQGSQWANQVFGERLLYGRDEYQHYRVFGPAEGSTENYRVLLFSAARLADRQYLHAELLRVAD